MDLSLTRRIIRSAWTEELGFEPAAFTIRLERARELRRRYHFEGFVREPAEAFYEVRGGAKDYYVFLDLSGGAEHYCTCPDGARKIRLSFLAGSLCKHVLALLLDEERAYLLAPYLCLLKRAWATGRRTCASYGRMR